MSVDFWADSAEVDLPEPPAPSFAEVPDKAWVLIKNTTSEQKEGAQPSIKTIEGKNGGEDWFKFKTAFLVEGGDDKIKPAHIGKYIFFECNTHRHPEKDSALMPCGGALYNLILDTLAPMPGTATERWAVARPILAKKAIEEGLTPDSFAGDKQHMYAVVFKEVLKDKAYTVIAQTYTPKQKAGSTFQPSQTVGSITANTPENRTEKKIAKAVEAAKTGSNF